MFKLAQISIDNDNDKVSLKMLSLLAIILLVKLNNTLNYKGFTAKIEVSADDDVFVGRLIDIKDIVS